LLEGKGPSRHKGVGTKERGVRSRLAGVTLLDVALVAEQIHVFPNGFSSFGPSHNMVGMQAEESPRSAKDLIAARANIPTGSLVEVAAKERFLPCGGELTLIRVA
jgi:hypothetical protein